MSIELATPVLASTASQFLLFAQGNGYFALGLTTIREVFPLTEQNLAPIPNTPNFILGLMNLRGEIIAVADFGLFLGISATDQTQPESRIFVVEIGNSHRSGVVPLRLALAVSRVEGVVTLQQENIASAVEVSPDLAQFLRGLYNLDGRLTMILDAEAMVVSGRW